MSKRLFLCAMALVLCCGGVSAQQPNQPGIASMIFAGQDGPPYPVIVNWGSTVIGLEFQGAPGAPFAMVSADSGILLTPGLPIGGPGILDIDITGGITFVLNGLSGTSFFDVLSIMDPTGFSNWTLPIASNGTLGVLQSVVVDSLNPAGFTLTAAAEVTVQVQQFLFLAVPGGGDDVFANINLAFGTTQFYDQTYSTVSTSSNGSITFGGGDAGPFPTQMAPALPSQTDFNEGFPRIAGLWTDLLPGVAIAAGNFVLFFIEDLNGWRATWTAMDNYGDPGGAMAGMPLGGMGNTFTVAYAYNSTITPTNPLGLPAGTITFDYTLPDPGFATPFPGGLIADWGIAGITPGGTAPAASPVPAGGMPIDPNPPTVIDIASPPNTSAAANGALGSFIAEYGIGTAQGVLNTAALSATGAQCYFFPQVFTATQANTYSFLRNGF